MIYMWQTSNIEVKSNPFEKYSTITVNSLSNETVNIRVISIFGEVLFSSSAYFTNQPFEIGHDLASGFYMLEVNDAGKITSLKLIKQ